jgi:ribosome-associated toxin RatA of RatAB toxin-antitoxin module
MAAIQVRKSALVMQPAPTMFDLIEGAEHYPHFLPWCAGATILARDDSLVSADIHVDYRGLRFTMRTRNPKRKPEFMAIHLERGPFRHFYGEWRLLPLAHDACKVEFELHYEFDSSLATRLAGPVFAKMADTLVDAFVKRAHAMPPAAVAVVTVPVVASPPASSAAPSAAPSPPAERSSAAPSCDAPSCDESARPASSSALPATTAPPTAPPAASAPTAAPDAPAPGAEAPPS